MKVLFKILFWFIGYRYSEGIPYKFAKDGFAKTLYAHKPTQTKEQGFANEMILGKYCQPFNDRWFLFKVALNPKKYFPKKSI